MQRNCLLVMLPWLILCAAVVVACAAEQPNPLATDDQSKALPQNAPALTSPNTNRPVSANKASHGNDVDPNYAVVLPTNQVNQLTIKLTAENWKAMQDNMTKLYGQRPTPVPDNNGQPGGPFGGGSPLGGGGRFVTENPTWVPATIVFNGQTWAQVGIRYKGNSSLRSSWNSGTRKLPFKLEFDHFEDQYPQTKNQRFYGFKGLSFANNFSDGSAMRETVTYDLLEAAGLVASETGFYEVSLDYGEGLVWLGLYTAVEETDDTVIKRFFGNDQGNIYKPDGPAANFSKGAFESIKTSFQKENNKAKADWSDIETLYRLLHSEERTANPAAWQAKLEAMFDVPVFLKWLALSAVIQHWDSYGGMPHNYYLYHNPTNGRLTWISWDHNLVLGASVGGRVGFGRNLSLDKNELGDNWPLIRYLLDVPAYNTMYIGFIRQLTQDVFDADKLARRYQELAQVVGPSVARESSESAFQAAVQQLTDRTYERAKAAADFLATR